MLRRLLELGLTCLVGMGSRRRDRLGVSRFVLVMRPRSRAYDVEEIFWVSIVEEKNIYAAFEHLWIHSRCRS